MRRVQRPIGTSPLRAWIDDKIAKVYGGPDIGSLEDPPPGPPREQVSCAACGRPMPEHDVLRTRETSRFRCPG